MFDENQISVKEVIDKKWNIVRYTFTVPLSHNAEIEAYVIADGDTLDFADIVSKKGEHPLAFDTGLLSSAYGHGIRLGTAETRRLFRYIVSYVRKRHPEIKNIKSTRVTGARPSSAKRSMNMALPEMVRESAYTVEVVPDDSNLFPKTDAAIFRRNTKQIFVRKRYAANQHIMNHEIGHALYDHVQSIQWVDAFQQDPEAWAEFLTTSTARSYQQRHEHQNDDERNDPRQYDWVEACADLWMEYKAGRFADLPALRQVLEHMLNM